VWLYFVEQASNCQIIHIDIFQAKEYEENHFDE